MSHVDGVDDGVGYGVFGKSDSWLGAWPQRQRLWCAWLQQQQPRCVWQQRQQRWCVWREH